MDWYALFVVTGKEECTKRWLSNYFSESELITLIPKRKLLERREGKTYHVVKKMFPGYILVNVEMNPETYTTIRNIPDLIRILNTGEYYTKIPVEEIKSITRLLGEDSVLDYSKVFFENSRIVVKSGPLKGKEGLIKAVDRRKLRVKIAIEFLGAIKEIDVGIEMLH